MEKKQTVTKFIVPLFYSIAIFLMIFYQWNEQNSIRQGGNSPLYRNLIEYPAYVRRGFNLEFTKKIPSGEDWVRFKSPPFRIMDSGLQGLPKRSYLSPFGNRDEEFTIIIALEIDEDAIAYFQNDTSALPGLFLACIGENWEIYFNGSLVCSQMHLDRNGRIISRRTWRDVYFPIDKTLVTQGTNILAFRIIGDPSYDATGIYYVTPNYFDDFQSIYGRQVNIMFLLLCGVFGFTGLYYIMIFFSVRQKKEVFNLYYGIFSFLLCGYSLARNGLVNFILPDSDLSIRLEFFTLFLVVPFMGFFIESLGRQKITKISWGIMIFCFVISMFQIFFCPQFGQEMLYIWNVVILLYFSYIFVYDIIYFYFWERKKKLVLNGNEKISDTFVGNVLIGSVIVYFCGIYDILDVMFFHNSYTLFLYSCFVFHIGIAFTLSQRFSGMYKQLEHSNILLEKAVQERTVELEKQTEIALNASREKSRFLASMSHEIRTPMNAITGMAELLLRKDLTDEVKSYAQDIKQAGDNLVAIINDILDISKIEAGKLEIVNAEYLLSSLLDNTVSIIKMQLGNKPVQFSVNIDKTIPGRLSGDEVRLRQIILNLLSNAVKYTEEGRIDFSVDAYKREGKKIWLKISVSDTGTGIKQKELNHLFEDFVRFDVKKNRGKEGSGLGLAITKRLCSAMGGDISVESVYGEGSTFTVIIPQDIATPEPAAYNKEKTNEEKTAGKRAFPDARILIVDDLPVNLKVAKGLLAPYKANVEACTSGKEALELVKQNKYDLIFMDHMMEEMDGIETTRQIRESGFSAPIIALTANAVAGMKEMFLENGFNDFIPKPIDIEKLDETLNRWLV